jgi:hypothetical protein
MDGHRFDRLARAVGTRRSRRSLGRGAAGAVATLVGLMRLSSGAAQAGFVPLGGACYDTLQCRDEFVSCDDNGFAYDGDLNCCRYDGGFCRLDEHCCGQSRCINDTCGFAYGPGQYVYPLGEFCATRQDCSGGAYATDCADNGFGPGARVCCTINGFDCGTDFDCCGTDVCYFGGPGIGSRCVQFRWGPCRDDAGCAGNLVCRGGQCQSL